MVRLSLKNGIEKSSYSIISKSCQGPTPYFFPIYPVYPVQSKFINFNIAVPIRPINTPVIVPIVTIVVVSVKICSMLK